MAETKVKQLPKGELFWRVESFPTLEKAKAAAPPYRWNPDTVSYDGLPSLTAEVAGKAWLFTLGPKGGATAGGAEVAEIGPVPPLSAPEYLLRVNYGHGPPGAKTPVLARPAKGQGTTLRGFGFKGAAGSVPFPRVPAVRIWRMSVMPPQGEKITSSNPFFQYGPSCIYQDIEIDSNLDETSSLAGIF